MSGSLALVAGRDPGGTDTGHSAYVRAHGRAARRAGYRPLILCLGASATTVDSEYGLIRRVATPARPLRQLMIAAHGPLLARELIAIANRGDEPLLAHGFGVWGYAAVRAVESLRARGRAAAALLSSYTTHRDENGSQVAGLNGSRSRVALSYRAQAAWSGLAVARFERVAYRGADAVFVNYDSVAGLARAAYGEDLPLRRLPYAPETAFASSAAAAEPRAVPAEIARLAPADAPLVVSIARHQPRKGVDVLIDALALARDRGTVIRACLVGDGPLLDAHRGRIARLGLERSIAVSGWVADPGPHLAAADVFALPSRREQSGSLALLEALHAGVAVVACDVDGIAEDLEHERTGLLVAPDRPPELAAALLRVAGDRELRARLAAAGRKLARARFSAKALTAALDAAYREHGLEPAG